MAPPLVLHDLTIPRDGTATLRAVQRSLWRVLVHDVVGLPTRLLDAPRRALHGRVVALLQELLARDPRRVARALAHPTVTAIGGAARRHAGPLGQPRVLGDAVLELDLLILLELAAQGDLAGEVVVERVGDTWPTLRSPSANLLVETAPETTALAFAPHRIRAHRGETTEELDLRAAARGADGSLLRTEAPYHEITAGILLATTDNNPLANVQAHPERAGNRLDLGGRPVEEWVATLREAFAIVAAHVPLVFEEMKLLLELVVPVGHHPERHFSCSFEEAVGSISLTLHPNVMTLAEALIHEFQHNKLNAVFRFDPVLHDAHTSLHRSPVRPDLRPLHGVLMAVHAFHPVARLYENMTAAQHPLAKQHDWPKRFRDVLRINRESAATVLAHGRPTPLGRGLLDEMRALEEHFRRYEQLQWPTTLVGNA